ncbi:MAG TPA: polysaccharide deacetylase family protein [Candidatus Methylomirabilis sp.]|nr:polysaccharide deacetylase family protein [Candidatus Methylomirabilis sp.]
MGKSLLLVLGVVVVLVGGVTLWISRLPSKPAAGPTTPAQKQATLAADPLAAVLSDILAAYRKIIVLVEGESSLTPADRARVYPVGEFLFDENHARLASLTELLTADLEARLAAAGPSSSGKVEQFLDRLENDPAYHDADKLAFRDVLEDLAALLGESQGPSRLKQELGARIASDLKALGVIQALYEKELGQIFSRFQNRGMAVRREAWEKYVAFLKTQYDPAVILKEYETATGFPSDTRGQGPQKSDPGLEIFGTGLPAKTLVLTFDDGPHPRYTASILDTLKQFNVPAVFFEVGKNLGTVGENKTVKWARAAEASRLVLAAGMPVANHTYTHALLPKLSEKDLANELELTNQLLTEVSHATPSLFRAPYGARNDQVMASLGARHLRSIMWNIDSRDWADPIPMSIADRVLRTVDAERRGILLFHDIHERTIEALPLILEGLKAEGYQFAGWNGSDFVVAGAPAAAKSAEAQARPARTTPYRESWAAIIGIDDYRKWPRLRYAVNDATGVKEVLIQKYKFKPENIFTLMNQEATRENILSVLGDKLGNPQAIKRDDRVFVFFAGHGITRKLPSGRDLGYIVPVEADVNNYHGQSISMTNFQDIAEAIPAKHVIFVMDSCYSGLGLTRGGRADQSQNYLMEISRRTARQMLTAGGADQQVADNGPNGHSIFTWTLLQALEGKADLNGDGFITGSELAAYIGPVVSNLSRQTPAFGNLPGSEGGEFVFEMGHESEFLSGVSAQLDEEAIRLNAEMDRLRAEIETKTQRNQRLKQELARAQSTLKGLEKPGKAVPATARPETMWTHNDRGIALFKAKQYPEALKDFMAAVELNPTHPLPANNMGYTYYRMEQFDEAARWFEKTVALEPRRAIAYMNLGDAYAKLNRNAEAKKAFEKFLELQPTSKSAPYAQEMLKSLE